MKEATRLFEDAEVARTERSLINWCRPNPQGQTKLDCYFDANENKWLITPQSVTLAIAEEQARKGEGAAHSSESANTLRKPSETGTHTGAGTTENTPNAAELKKRIGLLENDKDIRDKEISRLKDLLTEQGMHFGKQIADVAERVGEYKADLRTTRKELQTANRKLLQLNPGPVEVKEEEQEESERVLHTDPAPIPVSVHAPETPATTRVHVISHDVPPETPGAPKEEGRGGEAPLQV